MIEQIQWLLKWVKKPDYLVYFSFGATIEGFAAGAIVPQPKDRYVFCCRPSRVLNEGIPGYVGRMEGREFCNSVLLSEADLKPETVQKTKAIAF